MSIRRTGLADSPQNTKSSVPAEVFFSDDADIHEGRRIRPPSKQSPGTRSEREVNEKSQS